MTAVVLLPIIVQLVQLGISIAPDIIAAGHTELSLLDPDSLPPSDMQKAEIMAALDRANAVLQASQPAP